MADWKDVLDRLLKEVQEDEACQKLLEDLLSYAVYAVAKNEADIRDTLRNRVKVQNWPVDENSAVELDILWPGAGYDSAACAGSFEVLALLANKGLLKLRDFMGASGGATSALLALADPQESSRTMLTFYMVYAKWVAETPRSTLRQVWQTTPLWREIYRRAIHEDEAFERVNQRGYVAMACGRTIFQWQNWVLHHFTDREQCVQAYEASGEASLRGALAGRQLPGLQGLGKCCDGGRANEVVYFHSPVARANCRSIITATTALQQAVRWRPSTTCFEGALMMPSACSVTPTTPANFDLCSMEAPSSATAVKSSGKETA